MRSQSYMTRAMRSRDPRFARILGKLGYERADMTPEEPAPEPEDELRDLRAEYQRVIGKRAFNGWDAETLRSKIADAQG